MKIIVQMQNVQIAEIELDNVENDLLDGKSKSREILGQYITEQVDAWVDSVVPDLGWLSDEQNIKYDCEILYGQSVKVQQAWNGQTWAVVDADSGVKYLRYTPLERPTIQILLEILACKIVE